MSIVQFLLCTRYIKNWTWKYGYDVLVWIKNKFKSNS